MNISTTDVAPAAGTAKPGAGLPGATGGRPRAMGNGHGKPPPLSVQSRELLDACFAQFGPKLDAGIKASMAAANHIFDRRSKASDREIMEFLERRGEFVALFAKNLSGMFAQWMAGKRRTERRPDVDASPASLSVLSDDDYAMQETLTRTIVELRRTTRDSLFALDARIACVLNEDGARRLDNPFAVDYLLDAIGMSLRACFPNPRIHRRVMQHLIGNIAEAVNKRYIALNRFLASKDILPGAEASVRARSELRPDDDSDLLPLFNKLLSAPGKPEPPPRELADAIDVPDDLVDPNTPVRAAGRGGFASASGGSIDRSVDPAPLVHALGRGAQGVLATSGTAVNTEAASASMLVAALALPAPTVTNAILAAFAQYLQQGNPVSPSAAGASAAALGNGSQTDATHTRTADAVVAWPSPMVAMLDQWQRFDPMAQSAWSTATDAAGAQPAVPLNRIPIIRVAVADTIVDPLDGVTMDVMTLLFDYVFRDSSIPDPMRLLFAGLQVPIAKAALLDRSFFSDRKHPARLLLDNLAAAAVGAHVNPVYMLALQALAQGIVADVCRDFKADVSVFAAADAKLAELVVVEQDRIAAACASEVAAALADEQSNVHLEVARELVAETLAGQDLPFEIQSFVETIWLDVLAQRHARQGPESEDWRDAVSTLEELLWSLTSKAATGQRARMSVMIPVLLRKLRMGCVEVDADPEQTSGFFDALYRHHIGALKPNAEPALLSGDTTAIVAANDEPSLVDAANDEPDTLDADRRRFKRVNLHDFVDEMAVGTWLTFKRQSEKIFARLFWISPKRTKFVFSTRSHSLALIFTPEELVWELGTNRARLLVEPVPMFDRAINAALDMLAANQEFTTTH